MKTIINHVAPATIKQNKTSVSIYKDDGSFDLFKKNIESAGILEPLVITKDYVLISGGRRLKAAIDLGFKTVPVIYTEVKPGQEAFTIVSHNQQRVKTPSQILAEAKILEATYGIRQGARTDLNPRAKEFLLKRKELASETTIAKLKSIEKNVEVLCGSDKAASDKVWKKIDNKDVSLDAIYNELKKQVASIHHKVISITPRELINTHYAIHNKSCQTMTEVEENSIATIITSPPYYKMRDYDNGANELGHEKNVTEFINNLATLFTDCKRILKNNGSLWVNLGDCIKDGGYQLVPERFAIKMVEMGWILNDHLIWVKSNPQYSSGPRSVRAHENLFHFVKTKDFVYNRDWMRDNADFEINFIGQANGTKKLRSFLDMDRNIIKTSTSSTLALRAMCKDEKFELNHTATFPIGIPALAILSSSNPGDTVLDMFSGTGTTGEAAIQLKRKYVGYEINKEHLTASIVRLRNYTSKETKPMAKTIERKIEILPELREAA